MTTQSLPLPDHNQYIVITSDSEQEATERAREIGVDAVLVHVEPPTEEPELSQFVFSLTNEVQSDFDDWEYLHQHFLIPTLPNYPIEVID